jgi:hypothetical protein
VTAGGEYRESVDLSLILWQLHIEAESLTGIFLDLKDIPELPGALPQLDWFSQELKLFLRVDFLVGIFKVHTDGVVIFQLDG